MAGIRKVLAIVTGVSLLWMCGCSLPHATPPPAPKPPAAAVTATFPIHSELIDYVEFPGRTASVEAVDVRSRVGGYLVEIAFRDGVDVRAGDLLFRIDPQPFEIALAQAKAALR